MTDVYRWYVSNDGGDRYTLLTARDRQSAIDEVIDQGSYNELEPDPPDHPEWHVQFKICEASKYGIDDIKISGNKFLEDLYTQNDDWNNPDNDDSPFDCTEKQAKDLSDMLTATYRAWCDKHSTHPHTWVFKDTRNEEEIVLPHPNRPKT